MSASLVAKITQTGIIAICRKIYGDDLIHLAAALQKGGVALMEVTFDQSDPNANERTAEAISLLCSKFPDMRFGAGTVLTRAQVDAAKSAGGEFIISPNTDLDVIRYTKEAGLVSIPGAMTPSEVMAAHHAGADFVKLFPAASLGVKYIKDITAPINHVKLLATGGISTENFADYLRAGCRGAGISSSLCDKARIQAGDWDSFTAAAKALTAIFDTVAEEKGWRK
ncbi:putative KHG/KDPG aldolase [bioreactor metagenome]|uniref:Putative KHG/KDPG aldolase n=1 Tax=bioreactor metagenome TaxID=1076179 RepID=A0A644YDP0_9ZZZZ|nr:bifunctional 4-hydroxy-2-oxoglutarate aldolase/2-dehydro-3-deoxy-phosphogluconate aldolase [Christensenella sp.]